MKVILDATFLIFGALCLTMSILYRILEGKWDVYITILTIVMFSFYFIVYIILRCCGLIKQQKEVI